MRADCPVCKGETPHEVVFEKWGYPIQKCSICGVGSTRNASLVVAEDLYNESYFQGGQRDGYVDYVGSEAVLRAEFRKALAHLRRAGCKGGRLLEIGSAYGYFLMEAERYFRCTGLEVSRSAVTACRMRGLEVVSPNDPEAEAIWSRKDCYDAVVMLDCIEHLPDPSRTIGRIAEVLRPGGTLMVTTGDSESLLAKVMGSHWRLMTPPQHLYFYSPRTLAALLRQYGLRVVDCSKPWKVVPLTLAAYQMASRLGLQLRLSERLNSFGMPVNLFDSFRMLARK